MSDIDVAARIRAMLDGGCKVSDLSTLLRDVDEEIDRLRAELAEAQRERDEWRSSSEEYANMLCEVDD